MTDRRDDQDLPTYDIDPWGEDESYLDIDADIKGCMFVAFLIFMAVVMPICFMLKGLGLM